MLLFFCVVLFSSFAFSKDVIVTFDSKSIQQSFCKQFQCLSTFENAFYGALVTYETEIQTEGPLTFDFDTVYIERDTPIFTENITSTEFTPFYSSDLVQTALVDTQHDGTGVHIYVLDTGIRATHEEFYDHTESYFRVSRAGPHSSYYGNGDEGCLHGTHVASLAAGLSVGQATNATIWDIPTLNCFGTGLVSEAILSIDWIISNAEKPAVVLMSWVSPYSKSLDLATKSLVDSGIVAFAAAGNHQSDACLFSPASTSECITVGTLNYNLSNTGPCVDSLSPGINITGAYFLGNNTYIQLTGTSMSAALLAGEFASYQSP